MNKVFINSEYITLGQFLKFTGFISNGGEAKYAVKTLKIKVNSEKEDRRGRKIYPGNMVEVEKCSFIVEKENENK